MKAYIALGGNMGDVRSHFIFAIQQLNTLGTVVQKSGLYRTAPFGVNSVQDDYLNAVIELDTELNPETLLQHLLHIEHLKGRVRTERFGARTLDLDVLAYENHSQNTPTLILPHPRMWDRAFVLIPLADIAPDFVHVNGESITARLAVLNARDVQLEQQMW